ncbi:NAD(P)/FAD-dependent oxidoreductase [Bacillus sp. B1-b2]|uniref:NAD(P)/FAD-dependent oxidoreductase n=1 Tax=Bacillus sp. B1-b2 TaxID=2653201 RepID=UPI001262690C|nr:NAD(P)/FAD-dependent oxidoreductase [Bacillus sp. B1-b2]KAB7670648.1 NAD(P)/FAD-dependent oxidoreductase [Bacillus sp. B1-b2]
MNHIFDCIIIGGGIAGLQAAIQLGRYNHEVLVIDKEDGRSTLCKSYHNILGYPDGVSGEELRNIGRQQAESLDVQFLKDSVESVKKVDSFFSVKTVKDTFSSRKLLIATGVLDHIPPLQELFPCLGVSVYLCPDCDGYEVQGKKTVVIGNGSVGANMAITLLYWTKELIYINHGGEEIEKNLREELSKHDIPIYEQTIKRVIAKGPEIRGFALENDLVIETNHSFIAFGGNKVRSDLAVQLGVEVLDNNHIKVHPRTKMTNIEGVWAAGDVVAHSEQVTIAMGEGSQAAIWIHKSLLKA